MNTLMEQEILTDMIRPYMALDIPKWDKRLSFTISVLVHGALFITVGALFVKVPQFGIDRGINSIEVNLVAAPAQPVPQATPVTPPIPVKTEFLEKKVVQRVVVKKIEKVIPSKTKGKDKITVQSTGGAISKAKPDYLKNPAPEYPEMARRRGYQGIVFLKADIDRNGTPIKVAIGKSSGHSILDEAALKAVKTWKFQPGRLGNMPIESVVLVPVRFYLNEN